MNITNIRAEMARMSSETQFNESYVAVHAHPGMDYPTIPPFHPEVIYPEYSFVATGGESNSVYEVVRACFHSAGLDREHYGSSRWNPLGKLITPGEVVLIKPNLVKESHPRYSQGWRCVLTHGSIIRAVADYIWKALDGKGTVVLADAPQTDSSFDAIARVLGLEAIRDFYLNQGLQFELLDLRREEWTNKNGVIVERRPLPHNHYGVVAFDLAAMSEFANHRGAGHYYGADYDSDVINHHHSGGRHEYLIAGIAIRADVVVSLPKLKTHKKAGITLALKNMVGINADKNWLPHHTEGEPMCGGDEHPNPKIVHRVERQLIRGLHRFALVAPRGGPWILQRARRVGGEIFGGTDEVIRSGNWWGNDTVWRMCLDLNKLVLYGATDGSLRSSMRENRKRHYVLVDGVVAGEGRGPMDPDPISAGLIIFGQNAPTVDAVGAYLMGFDPEKIAIVRQAFCCQHFPLVDHSWQDIRVLSNVAEWNAKITDIPYESTPHFKPHFGWKGHIERTSEKYSP